MINLQEWEKPVSLFPSFASVNIQEIQRRSKDKADELKKKVTEVITVLGFLLEHVCKQYTKMN